MRAPIERVLPGSRQLRIRSTAWPNTACRSPLASDSGRRPAERVRNGSRQPHRWSPVCCRTASRNAGPSAPRPGRRRRAALTRAAATGGDRPQLPSILDDPRPSRRSLATSVNAALPRPRAWLARAVALRALPDRPPALAQGPIHRGPLHLRLSSAADMVPTAHCAPVAVHLGGQRGSPALKLVRPVPVRRSTPAARRGRARARTSHVDRSSRWSSSTTSSSSGRRVS